MAKNFIKYSYRGNKSKIDIEHVTVHLQYDRGRRRVINRSNIRNDKCNKENVEKKTLRDFRGESLLPVGSSEKSF